MTARTRGLRPVIFLAALLLPHLLHASPLQVPNLACGDLRKSVAAMEKNSKNRALGQELCFKDCTIGRIPAATYWGNGESQDEIAVRNELSEYTEWSAWVSEVDLNGDGVDEVRIARWVGTANCVRDTYLKRITHGYALIRTPGLMELSAEAGNCGDASIAFLASPPAMYVIEKSYKINVYRIDKAFNLNLVCVMPRK